MVLNDLLINLNFYCSRKCVYYSKLLLSPIEEAYTKLVALIEFPSYCETYIRIYIRTYIRIYIRTYVRTYVRTYIRTYIGLMKSNNKKIPFI